VKGRVLVIAGSDSGGGAGIQADIKAITALGGFAMTALTALTAQDTLGVHDIVPVAPGFIRRQIDCVWDDLGTDAVKTGMLGDIATIRTVRDALRARPTVPFVLDPVMVAKGGASLLDSAAIGVLRSELLPMASLLTPNAPEAALLAGLPLDHVGQMEAVGRRLFALGAGAVLLKGGHLPGDVLTDLLFTADGIEEFTAPRIATRHTHGTGCTLASAIACGLAQGLALPAAIARARSYLQRAIAAAPGYGSGAGPLDHAVTTRCDPLVG
jgi:hydroxymethylpyrimidine/phosphomethylpyrimidine kinase